MSNQQIEVVNVSGHAVDVPGGGSIACGESTSVVKTQAVETLIKGGLIVERQIQSEREVPKPKPSAKKESDSK